MPASSSWNYSSTAFFSSSSAAICSAMARTSFCRSVVSAPSRLQLADLDAFLVLARFQLLRLGDGRTALAIQVAEPLKIDRAAAGREPFCNALEVIPEMGEIVHSLSC